MKPAKTDQAQSPRPKIDVLLNGSPDLIDDIFKFLVKEHPELAGREAKTKADLRKEFGGEAYYVAKRSAADVKQQVLGLWNGRNARTVARELGISRGSVYRHLKTACK
jgi:Mor family transcriptional regulator